MTRLASFQVLEGSFKGIDHKCIDLLTGSVTVGGVARKLRVLCSEVVYEIDGARFGESTAK